MSIPLLAFVFLVIGTVTGFILSYRFIRCLKKNQPEKWKELGSPSFFDNGSWANQRALRKFLNTLDSSTGSDQEVISRGRAVALINKIYVPTCALVLIAMFYFLVRH